MAISRLFVEIGKDVDRLNASLRQSMDTAKEAGIQVTASGQRMLAAFDRALNPTKDLAEQIRLLEKAGKSGAEIWAVYGNQMKAAAEAAQKNGQAVDATLTKHLELNKTTSAGKLNFETLGRSIQDFARNPLQAAQTGITSLMGSMGPLAVGIVSVAGAAAVAAKALFDMGVAAAEEAESLQNLSVSTGLRTQELQALTQIAKEAGLESLDLGRTIGKLNEQLGSREGGDFTRALVSNGIALEDVNGKAKSAIRLLDELRGKFVSIADPIERAQAMQAALGGRLRDLIPLLMSSNEGLEAQIKVMEETGPVWDDITQKKLMAFDAALDTIGRTWSGLVTDIKAGVGSILGDLTGLQSEAFDISKLSDEDKAKFYGSMQKGGFKPIETISIGSPYEAFKVDYDAMKVGEQMSRKVFESQQKLIAQGQDHIALRMKLAAEQEKFNNLLNKGTNEQVAAQAVVVRGLNEQLKATIELDRASEKRQSQQMSEYEFAVKLMEFKKREWEEIQRFKLDMTPTAKPFEIDAQPSGDLFKNLDKSISEVMKAFDQYHEQIRQMQEHTSEFVYTEQEQQLAELQTYYDEVQTLRDLDLISEQEYSDAKKRIAAEENAVKLSKAQTFLGTLAQMQTSHIRAIAAVGKAAAIAQATINTYEGATKALAQGGVWGMIQMGAVLAAGFAQVASIASQGFRAGGYTGSVSRDSVAGVVHGQEYVMNADATAQYLPLLEMLNQGREVGSQMDSGPGMGVWGRPVMNVQISNYGTGKTFNVEQVDETTVRIIARDEAYNVLSRRGPEVIAADLAYPNSRTSKAVARHTTARRGDR